VTQRNRLATGGRIDRHKPLSFTFGGKRHQGYQGDTLASALLANGVSVVGRSFKYHRPRGIVGAGPEEPNAILQVGGGASTLPNQCATQTELYDGLTAEFINCWPSVNFDLGAVTGLFSQLLPAGFVYKTFMWPKGFWKTYEYFIRRAAGLGVLSNEPDPDRYDKQNAHCDVLVVGGGPAGLAAAVAAGRAGARVILADEQSELGGSLLGSRETIDGAPAMQWAAAIVDELASMEEVRLVPRGTVFGYFDHNFLGILERVTDHLRPGVAKGPRERFWRVRARQVVNAAGAIERHLVFPDNDRPGIMLASAVSTYVNRYAIAPGSRTVVFTNSDSAYQTALDLADAGIDVAAVVDVRLEPNGDLPAQVRQKGIEVIGGHVIVGVGGRKRVNGVRIMRLDATGDGVQGATRKIACDMVAVSGGWSPTVNLHCQSGGKATYDPDKACFVPGEPVQAERSAGSCNGSFTLGECLAEGLAAGAEAAHAAGFGGGSVTVPMPSTNGMRVEPLRPMWVVPSRAPLSRRSKAFVDLQNDVPVADIVLAAREGYDSIQLVKRYTTLGMGTDQGRLGNINGMGILAETLGVDIAAIGTTTFRPVHTPIAFGAIAGRDTDGLADPVRKTAVHQWHEEADAEFEDAGQWKRPRYFPRPGETMQDAVNRECLAARNNVAISDASTLGKIDIRGPDAGELLNRVYTNAWTKLGVGRCRYGAMLREDGMMMDDGVTTRLGENHYLMSTTTGGAALVFGWLEWWLQTEWPELKVYLTSVTDHWAVAGVVGPDSRKVVSEACDGIDFSREAFPFMSYREGTVAGIPVRVFRISFTGELSFEINVSANYGRAVWEAVMAAGEKYGIAPYGLEAMRILRAEKGYIIDGQDTDGSRTPADMGMDWIVSKRKDFLGRRSLSRSDTVRDDRKQLVGLLTESPMEVLPEGGQIVDDPSANIPMPMIGHVTSSYYSAYLGRSIAMAVIKGGLSRMDETVYVPLADGRTISAKITGSVFYDPEGARRNS
jgi:sarcosine oxidase subunit alpha